ncbi:putative peptidoglycan glycosyltransferase FtsW [Pseudactinotalea sp. HY158]|uniref:peptidoglycan glycosyltransferase FtsW n=1 Tax=Pseudactinotalea sp. HY158 TaxID=2654547 RepID=UPI00129C9526|nr:putative peptidoglycan glycosyltransferase FtsW [Pseudactinotalea sp. HY158]QGH69831.1 cell division protein FtsW [Pseudactinotalea sp. HY158]
MSVIERPGRAARGRAPAASDAVPKRSSRRIAAWDAPTATYYLVVGTTAALLAIGLVMVLSASTVYSLKATGGRTPFEGFLSQAKFALLALPLMIVVSRLKVSWLRFLSWPILLLTAAMQLLLFVPAFRLSKGGNAAWVSIAGQNFQPSEFAKFGLAVWLGAVLAAKGPLLKDWKHVLLPGGVMSAYMIGMVFYTRDLGTALIFGLLIAGAFWVAGVPRIMFYGVGMVAVGVVAAFVVSSGNRMHRITEFLGRGESDPLGTSMQSIRALQGFGTGGLFGVGLGASRSKWLYLPEADNDFIFAIIGEELGLLGALVVLGLYLLLAIGMMRIIKRHPDPFAKIATAAIAAWVIGQALINIASAIGMAPVIGVPLPLISSGGSSLVTTMAALAFVIAFARTEPGCREVLQARSAGLRSSLAVLAPRRGRG